MSRMNTLLFFFSIISLHTLPTLASCPNNITAVYAFGDGFFDSGSNNGRFTVCNSFHAPYGASFPDRLPTGRFSDAEVAGDLISRHLGLKPLLPPYSLLLSEKDLLTGVSFASACSGMDDYTAKETNVLSLTDQFANFQAAVEMMKMKAGKEAAAAAVQGGLYLVSGGVHDFLNNFYSLPLRQVLGLDAFVLLMHKNLELILKRINSMGGMKMVVMGLPPIGCLPFDMTRNVKLLIRNCVDLHNEDAKAYNRKLKDRLREIELSLPGTKIKYVDIYSPIMDMIQDPSKYGMDVSKKGCCSTGLFEMGTTCTLIGVGCSTPSNYVFWDAIHPSQSTFKILAKQIQDKALPSLLF